MPQLVLPLIGVTGRAGAGKDTFCRLASEILLWHQKSALVLSCAEPLKYMCAEAFCMGLNVPRTAFFGSQAQKEAPLEMVPGWTGRKILQYIGTEGFRSIHPEVWSRHMLARAKMMLNVHDAVFVSDVRFPEEERIIHEAGGIIVRIRRPSADAIAATHSSESDSSKITEDYTIDNQDRELYHLQELVKDFLCAYNLNSSPSTPRPRD